MPDNVACIRCIDITFSKNIQNIIKWNELYHQKYYILFCAWWFFRTPKENPKIKQNVSVWLILLHICLYHFHPLMPFPVCSSTVGYYILNTFGSRQFCAQTSFGWHHNTKQIICIPNVCWQNCYRTGITGQLISEWHCFTKKKGTPRIWIQNIDHFIPVSWQDE
jgi:hypothetical protein